MEFEVLGSADGVMTVRVTGELKKAEAGRIEEGSSSVARPDTETIHPPAGH